MKIKSSTPVYFFTDVPYMPLHYAELRDVWHRSPHYEPTTQRRESFTTTTENPPPEDAIRLNLETLYRTSGPQALVQLLPRPFVEAMQQQQADALDKLILLLLGGFIAIVILDMRRPA